MTTEIVSITHTADGIRVKWPDSTANVFANSVYLAESYAHAVRAKEQARQRLIGPVAENLNRLDKILSGEGAPLAEMTKLRESLQDVAKALV